MGGYVLPLESGTRTFACKNFPFETVKKPQMGQFRVFICYIMLDFIVFKSQGVVNCNKPNMCLYFLKFCVIISV